MGGDEIQRQSVRKTFAICAPSPFLSNQIHRYREFVASKATILFDIGKVPNLGQCILGKFRTGKERHRFFTRDEPFVTGVHIREMVVKLLFLNSSNRPRYVYRSWWGGGGWRHRGWRVLLSERALCSSSTKLAGDRWDVWDARRSHSWPWAWRWALTSVPGWGTWTPGGGIEDGLG